jgi:uncharacterized membrane protein
MKSIFKLLPLLLAVACGSPASPAQYVYQIESDYAVALRAELAYEALPRCGKPSSPPVCSDLAVAKKVRTVSDAAWIAIQNAQEAVRTPGFEDSKLTSAVASAKALTKTFYDLATTLKK